MVPNPSPEEVEKWISTEEGRVRYAKWLNDRAKKIELAENDETGDPYRHGWTLPHYITANREFKRLRRGQYVSGGKRATKSERAARLAVKACFCIPRLTMWVFQDNDQTSKAQQQKLVWKYLPAELKKLNGKARHGWAKITYSPDNGFANRVIVFPNRSTMHFLTYNQKPEEFQGWDLGAKMDDPEIAKLVEDDPELFNLGAWMDENVTLPWLQTIEMRCTTNKASWMLTYSTMDGITPAVSSIVTGARTIAHERAPLVSENQKFVDDCPRGHLPTIQESTSMPGVSILYFWTQWNPFGNNYAGVKEKLVGKPVDQITQDAYGYSKDTKRRAYPKFGARNIITMDQVPAEGTNYQILDLAGARMWCTIWVRVCPGRPETFYIYRDWPDVDHFGEWATPGATNDQPDGVIGKAQTSRGMGWVAYKQAFLKAEEHKTTITRLELDELLRMRNAKELYDLDIVPDKWLTKHERDAQVRAAYRQQIRRIDDLLQTTAPMELSYNEIIETRFIDPRAGNEEKHRDTGSTTPIMELAKPNYDLVTGKQLAPGMLYRSASGVSIDIGMNAVNELLHWNMDEDFCPIINQPRLFVVDSCKQVIECLKTYTGLAGEKGPWKDFSDLVRYAATSGLCYIDPNRPRATGQSGGY